MSTHKYDYLKDVYPEYISKIQLYKICKISPKSATYLLEQRIIPAIDTGKATWRYKIALTDVIAYLEKRDLDGGQIPTGAVTSPKAKKRTRYELQITPEEMPLLKEYFKFIYSEYPNILTRTDVMEMTGISDRTLRDLMKAGVLTGKKGNSGTYMINKKSVINFAASSRYFKNHYASPLPEKILKGFDIWKRQEV